MATLDAGQIAAKLKGLPGWKHRDDAIRKQYEFKEFMDAIDFVGRIAKLAETADHHPDMLINYTRVTFTCATHSAGGVTEKDFQLATKIEAAYKSAHAK
ncbi:MAG TPA: 4a-hydroxytetrahydrobiopterin dehydratase [Candidatus Binataceae bacterium]|nr:4a-hydroxytetrahydrobiopterin dehydratase [Candidatus Binataceae bacterium]